MSKFTGQTALITGASSGMGVDYAHELAARGANLILVARRVERLEQVKQEVAAKHDVNIRVLPCDLGQADARAAMHATLRDEGVAVDILINNAGLAEHGPFIDAEWTALSNMIEVDVHALSHLTWLFAQDMKARGQGHILLVASVVGHVAPPNYAVYAGSKHYVRGFGNALHNELKPHGVSVTTVSPGATQTEFFDVAGHKPSAIVRMMTGSSAAVVQSAVKALERGKREVIPGLHNWLTALSARITPTAIMTRLLGFIFK